MVVQVWGTERSPSVTPRTRDEYDAEILANADYFTLVRKIGPGKFERHQGRSAAAMRRLGEALRGRWMIYAVRGQSSCHVENIGD